MSARPWRIERKVWPNKWRAQITVSTRERAEEELAFYSDCGWGTRYVWRAINRTSGEVLSR